MVIALQHVDRILRGQATRAADLRTGDVPIPAALVGSMVLLMGLTYGFFMGWYALINRAEPGYWQLLATTVKVPALFALTLLVTFPSLYVFNALVGSRLGVSAVFKLLLAAMAVTLAVLASFGPITAFFSVTTDDYPFMVLLNVALFAASGLLGLGFLLRTLHRLSVTDADVRLPRGLIMADDPAATSATGPGGESAVAQPGRELGALDPLEGVALGPQVRFVFVCWVAIFGLVGAQMSWVLRPFIGDPGEPFQWFRPRSSNFFEAVLGTLQSVLGG